MEETIQPSVAQTEEESVVLETTEEQSDSTQSEESVEELKTRLAKAEQERENQKIRAEKAERAAKAKTEVKTEVRTEVKVEAPSIKDYIALKNANIHEDDVDEVVEYAKFKKVSISEALKSSVIKATLAEKQEHRQTAQATNTGKTKGGNSNVSGETLLEKASKTGEVPEDDKAMNAMLDARYKR